MGRGTRSARGRDAAGADKRVRMGGEECPRALAAGNRSTVSEHSRCRGEGAPAGGPAEGRGLRQEVGDPGSSNFGRRKPNGTVKGDSIPTGVDTFLGTLTSEVLFEESPQGVGAAKQSAHCRGVGGPRLRGLWLQSGGGGRPCQGALTTRRWGEELYRGWSSTEGRAPPGREAGARKKRNWARES